MSKFRSAHSLIRIALDALLRSVDGLTENNWENNGMEYTLTQLRLAETKIDLVQALILKRVTDEMPEFHLPYNPEN